MEFRTPEEVLTPGIAIDGRTGEARGSIIQSDTSNDSVDGVVKDMSYGSKAMDVGRCAREAFVVESDGFASPAWCCFSEP